MGILKTRATDSRRTREGDNISGSGHNATERALHFAVQPWASSGASGIPRVRRAPHIWRRIPGEDRKPGRAGRPGVHANGTEDPVDYGKDIDRPAAEAILAVPSPGAEVVVGWGVGAERWT